MKTLQYIICLLFLLGGFTVWGQEKGGQTVEQAVEDFFTAFHAQDTASLRSMLAPEVVIQTIKPTIDGNFQTQDGTIDAFLQGLAAIPENMTFRERLDEIIVQQDGPLAHAWTPYSFFVNEERSHCGANSFQWLKTEKGWQLIYLVDTRRKDSCTTISNH